MKRFELTIKATYLPGWDLAEGLRELIQNARDAECQDGAKMTVSHAYRMRDRKPIGAVLIENEGTVFGKEAFLIGHTTKEGRKDLIGHFGEGMKLGCLALLRAGYAVKIRNGGEVWNPVIVQSERYNAEVLAFDVSDGNKFENRVLIEVLGVDLEQWETVKKRFLFLSPVANDEVLEVRGGRILTGASERGNMYVKGMYVCRVSDMSYGYDIDEADIDRDRRMINDKGSVTAGLLTDALRQGMLKDSIYSMLKRQVSEVDYMAAYMMSEESRQSLVNCFRAEYGADTLPTQSEEEVTALGHLGIRGVKIPYTLRSILESVLGDLPAKIRSLRMEAKHVYAMGDLTPAEQDVVYKSSALLRTALNAVDMDASVIENIRVVDFGDDKLKGTFHSADNGIRVARSTLSSVAKVLCVLIHEAAHMKGRDGTKEHEAAMHDLTEAVLERLLSN